MFSLYAQIDTFSVAREPANVPAALQAVNLDAAARDVTLFVDAQATSFVFLAIVLAALEVQDVLTQLAYQANQADFHLQSFYNAESTAPTDKTNQRVSFAGFSPKPQLSHWDYFAV